MDINELQMIINDMKSKPPFVVKYTLNGLRHGNQITDKDGKLKDLSTIPACNGAPHHMFKFERCSDKTMLDLLREGALKGIQDKVSRHKGLG